MPAVESVASTLRWPKIVDVAVIGGGVVGVATAWHLARRGVSVALFEKGEIAGEQSSRNWGFCRQQGRDPGEIPLAMESLRVWRRLNEKTGRETGFRQTGLLYVTEKESDVVRWQSWLKHAQPYQLESKILSAKELANKLPGADGNWRAGLWTASDGRAEPSKAVPAMAEDAKQHGAAVFTGCAVRGVDTGGGRLCALVTERGRVSASAAVLAGGAWSRLFCKRHGIKLKALNVKASVQRTGLAPKVFDGGLADHRFAIRRRLDGGYSVARPAATTYEIVPDGIRWFRDFWPAYLLERHRMKIRIGPNSLTELVQLANWSLDGMSPFEVVRTLDPEPDRAILDDAFSAMKKALPALADVQIKERWAGMIDATPDAVPVMDEVESMPGFFLASGFSGHGFGIGPGAGQLMADLITGATPCVDRASFRLSRLDEPGLRPWSV